MERKQNNDAESGERSAENPDHEPKPVNPGEAEDVGLVGGSGGPASIIYGEDDEADEHGDRLARGPEESA